MTHHADAIHDDLRLLIDAALDESIAESDWGTLCTHLAADRELRAYYIARRTLHAALTWEARSDERSAVVSDKPAPSAPRAKARVYAFPRSGYAAAASLLIAAAAVAVYVLVLNPTPEAVDPKTATQPMATVLDTTGGGTLIVDDAVVVPGQSLRTGEIVLDTGAGEFRLDNGVGVRLAGATRLVLHDTRRATVVAGSVTFDCPHSVTGYTVAAPHGVRYVDLGTRFEVNVDERTGHSRLTVLDGSVQVQALGSDPVTLTAGQRARVVLVDGKPVVDVRRAPLLPLAGDVHLDDAMALGGTTANGGVFPLGFTAAKDPPTLNGMVATRVAAPADDASPAVYTFECRDTATDALFRFDVTLEGFIVRGGVHVPAERLGGVSGAVGVHTGTGAERRNAVEIDSASTGGGDREVLRITVANVRVVEPGRLVGSLAPVGFTAVNIRSAKDGDDAGDVLDAETGATLGRWTGAGFRELVTLDEPAISVDIAPTSHRATLHGFRVRFAPAPSPATNGAPPGETDPRLN